MNHANETDKNPQLKDEQQKAKAATDMPIKNEASNSIKNTAAESEGLNQVKTNANDLEPGMRKDPDAGETD